MILIVHFGSKKTPFIAEMISQCGYASRIVDWKALTEPDCLSAKGIVFSGSPVLLTSNDANPYLDQLQWIHKITAPLLGICFGHQLIGLLHGCEIYKGMEVRTTIPIRIIKKDPLVNALEEHTLMAQDHTEGITLPSGFTLLASSENYPVEAMRHPTRKIWGVQFHPEVSGENGLQVFRNFISVI